MGGDGQKNRKYATNTAKIRDVVELHIMIAELIHPAIDYNGRVVVADLIELLCERQGL